MAPAQLPRLRSDASLQWTRAVFFGGMRHAVLAELVSRVQAYRPGADSGVIAKAYGHAEVAHQGQMRKSGEPYLPIPCPWPASSPSSSSTSRGVCRAAA